MLLSGGNLSIIEDENLSEKFPAETEFYKIGSWLLKLHPVDQPSSFHESDFSGTSHSSLIVATNFCDCLYLCTSTGGTANWSSLPPL
jgi:hypothetical protein